ncbi:rod shape-determining protein MreD [Lacinutrix venerupis]|uniref:Rod shape-determining protein MreD n=1 Tax=Lacinutrix venerupis TaxID=1486034 RepID=A0AAC9LQ09_9FLAO|nr:rod shape-determining protein MreD [Lacinutrix venerupis]APY01153.1 rod shape-determining protein MreD [Lacinutrix venerupis]RLJ67315.1 rod shape-determining protein MreD [Lacinutrix venerupis]
MTNFLSIHTIRFVILLLLQVLLLSHVNFMGYINPYPYILFILLFPIKNNRMLFILLSFLLGLFIDMFLDSGGIHAAASVTIAFIRPAALKFSFGALYDHQAIKFNQVDFGQRFIYISILTLIHHFILFSLEIFNFSKIILVLQNTLFSSIFTILLSILITIIFSGTNKK